MKGGIHFKFNKLSKGILNNIKNEVEKLSLYTEEYPETRKEEESDIKGTIDDILARLEINLLKDYEETMKESIDEVWNFDYIVRESVIMKGGLDIMTRLYHPQRDDGDIFYGRTIVKKGANLFICWLDE